LKINRIKVPSNVKEEESKSPLCDTDLKKNNSQDLNTVEKETDCLNLKTEVENKNNQNLNKEELLKNVEEEIHDDQSAHSIINENSMENHNNIEKINSEINTDNNRIDNLEEKKIDEEKLKLGENHKIKNIKNNRKEKLCKSEEKKKKINKKKISFNILNTCENFDYDLKKIGLEEEADEDYYVLNTDINLISKPESFDFFNFYSKNNFNGTLNSFYKSNSNEDTSNFFNSSLMRKSVSSLKHSRSSSTSSLFETKNTYTPNNPNIIYISDLFSKVHLFGIYDIPMYFHSDFIKYLKLKIPKNIFTLNELKEYLINEITKEAKLLNDEKFERIKIEKNKFLSFFNSNNLRENFKNEKQSNWVFSETLESSQTLSEINKKELDEHLNGGHSEDFIHSYSKIIYESANFKQQADLYINYIKKIDKDNICQIILHIYSMKGFINERVDFMLKEKFTNKSNLIGFLVILIAIMKCDGINNLFGFFYPKNLVFQDPNSKKKFIRLFKELDIKTFNFKPILDKLDNEKNNFYEKISKYIFLFKIDQA